MQYISELRTALGDDVVFTDVETRQKHSADQTENLVFLPDVVVKPRDTEGVANVMRICNAHRVPVTVQGARSGLAGAALPVKGGVALSMARFDRILDVDAANFQVTTEPGVITEHLQNTLQTHGLFYPPDPAGRGWSFIGGNVNTNAGGLKGAKYGVTRDYVINLEIVLPTGDILWTAANTLKNATGYNLTQLIVGSEGTLAVVTKIVLKLLPLPPYSLLLLVPFSNAEDACRAVGAIFQAGIVPSGMEFMEQKALEYAVRYVGETEFAIDNRYGAQLLIEVDGHNLAVLHEDCEKIADIVAQYDVGDVLFADSEAQKNSLWKLRRNLGNAVKTLSTIKMGDDVVVPRAKLPELLRGVQRIAAEKELETVCWGHLGDGNLHVTIVNSEAVTEAWMARALDGKRAIFELTHSLGGMLSAEHGVGWVQKAYMPIFFDAVHLNLLRGIKKVFDPNGILNPHKIFD